MSNQPPSNEPPRRPDLRAERTPSASPGGPAERAKRLTVGTCVRWAMILLVGVGLGKFLLSGDTSAPRREATGEDPPSAKTAAEEGSVEKATMEAIRQRQLVTVRRQRAEIISLAEELGAALDALDSRVQSCKEVAASLSTGESGKKVAANPTLVKRYVAVTELPLPAVDQGAKAKQLIAEAVAPLQAAQASPTDASAVPEDLHAQLDTQLKAAKDAAVAYEKRAEELQAIVADATGEPGKRSLEEAVRESKLDEARQRTALMLARREEARKKGDAALAEEQARQEAAAKAAELTKVQEVGKIEAATAAKRLLAAKEAADLEQKQVVIQQKRAFVRSPEGRRQIETYLQPFINPGFTQPNEQYWAPSDKTTQKGPVSLSRLRAAGALGDDTKGLFALGKAANNEGNDRPHWQLEPILAPYKLSAHAIDYLKTAQTLLIDYGDAMIEEGLLAK